MKQPLHIFIIILFELLIGFNALSQKHVITIDSNQRVASILLASWEYDSLVKNNLAGADLSHEIYQKFDDKFDFIFFLLNEVKTPSTVTTSGYCAATNNRIGVGLGQQVQGIVLGAYPGKGSPSSEGSDGNLKATIVLSQRSSIMSGPSLHEILHTWANYGIPGSFFNGGIESTQNGGHWGFNGGSTPGQLGGFKQSTLQTNVGGNPNTYSVGAFGWNVNNGNSVPYNQLELYLMGMIPISQVSPFDGFSGLSQQTFVGNNIQFNATNRVTYDSNKLLTILGGPRIPSSANSQKKFRSLIVVITKTALTSTEWTYYNDQSERFGRTGDEGTYLYNFWEATNGIGTMQTDNLLNAIRNCVIVSDTNDVCAGYPITFTASLNNNLVATSYQWTKNNTIIPNANAATYKATLNNRDTIRCIVNNGLSNQAVSNFIVAQVEVTPNVPVITANGALTICPGDSIILSQSLNDPTTIGTYHQWYRNNLPVPGVPNFLKLIVKDSGTYYLSVSDSAAPMMNYFNTRQKIGCGAISASIKVLLNTAITAKISNSRPLAFCMGDSTILSSNATSGNQWKLNGVPIQGATGTSYVVKASGDYLITNTNSCGISANSAATTVTVNPIPAKPTITRDVNNNLVSSSAIGNQWFSGTSAIASATAQNYKPLTDGNYTVQVTQNGCISPTSDAYYYLVTAIINVNTNESVTIYPNPVKDVLIVNYKLLNIHSVNAQLYNVNGIKMIDQKNVRTGCSINMSSFATGDYILNLENATTGKIIYSCHIIKVR